MTNRSARKLLLREALDVGPDVTFLEGVRGHAAVIESSETGPARIVRVSRDGDEVCWAFSLEAGADRPHFYPDDLPFHTGLPCKVNWDDEDGLVVSWAVLPTPEFRSKLKERMASLRGVELPEEFKNLAEQLKGKSREEMVEIMRELRDDFPQSIVDHAQATLGDLSDGSLPDAAAALVSEATAFHEERDWMASSEETAGPVYVTTTLRREDRIRP